MNRLAPAQPTAYDPAPHARTLAAAGGCDGLIDISIVKIALRTIRDDVDANAVALPVLVLFAPQQARYGRRHDSRLVPPVFFRERTFTGALAALTSLLWRRRLLPLAFPVAADTHAFGGVRGSGAALPGMAEIGSPHPRDIGSRPGPMALRSVANSDPLLRRSVIRPRVPARLITAVTVLAAGLTAASAVRPPLAGLGRLPAQAAATDLPRAIERQAICKRKC